VLLGVIRDLLDVKTRRNSAVVITLRTARNVELMFAAISRNIFSASARAASAERPRSLARSSIAARTRGAERIISWILWRGRSVGPSTTFSSRYRKTRIERRTLRATASWPSARRSCTKRVRSIGSATFAARLR
jgi:hypothetical protein